MKHGGGSHLTVALETQGLRKSFGGVLVIDDLSISVDEGEALGYRRSQRGGQDHLVQPDHRGRARRRRQGDLRRQGHHRTSPATNVAAQGIGRTFQIPKPFSGMTVFENVLVGATHGRNMPERASYDHCIDILEITGLHKKVQHPGRFAHPARPQAARAGPGSGHRSQAAASRRDRRRPHRGRGAGPDRGDPKLRQTGVTIVWIEHIVHALLAVVDRITVIQFGRKLCEGDPHEVMNSAEVQACYMGGTPA